MTNDSVHPEYLASTAKLADERGRFFMPMAVGTDFSTSQWSRYVRHDASWVDPDITSTEFDPVFRVVLDGMRSCRVGGITPKLIRDNPGAPEAWLARYAARVGRAFDIDVKAEGVGGDLDAWWWMALHADVVISCDVARLDTSTLFSAVWKVHFATARGDLSATMLSHAKECAGEGGTVSLVPLVRKFEGRAGWSMLVVAAPGLAGELAKEVVRRQQHDEVLKADETLDVGVLVTMQAVSYWSDGVMADDIEKYILSALRRCDTHPALEIAAIRGLAAAEGVAVAEGRPPAKLDGMAELCHSFIIKRLNKGDPLAVSTIELALHAVQVVLDAGVIERKRWESDEGRSLFRSELDDLRKRLVAALAARRARARASNAAPLPPLRQSHERPTNWSTTRLHLLLDDVIAMLRALRDQTGAIPLALMVSAGGDSDADGEPFFRELRSDWDVREALSTIVGDPFDQRSDDWEALGRSVVVQLWWPSVAPRPVARKTDNGWEAVGWGHAELRLLGASAAMVFCSEWRHPTGTELKLGKFSGEGPWRHVEWAALRKTTRVVLSLIKGTLGGVQPVGHRDTWTMPAAAANVRAGERVLMGDSYGSTADLPD